MTTILVTGANQGLGLAVVDGAARRLGSQADVYLTGRNPDRVRAAADRLERAGRPVRTAVLDVRDTDAVEALAAQLAERHGGIDVVISNAAARITPERPPAEQVEGFVDTRALRHRPHVARRSRLGNDRLRGGRKNGAGGSGGLARPHQRAQSPERAAVDVVELAVGPADPAHYGQLVQHGRVIPWK